MKIGYANRKVALKMSILRNYGDGENGSGVYVDVQQAAAWATSDDTRRRRPQSAHASVWRDDQGRLRARLPGDHGRPPDRVGGHITAGVLRAIPQQGSVLPLHLRHPDGSLEQARANAWATERGWANRVHAAFKAMLDDCVASPKGPHLALVDALGIGPRARKHMQHTATIQENLIAAAFGSSPDGVESPAADGQGDPRWDASRRIHAPA